MISTNKIIFMAISLIICFGVPVILGFYVCKKHKGEFTSILAGAAVFFVFQIISRIPMLKYLGKTAWYQNMSKNVLLISLFLGLTAGLFEEIGRYVGYKLFLKKDLNWENGVAFGVGHGGIEAILIVGITYLNNIIYATMLNSGNFDKVIAPKLPQGLAEYIKATIINTPDYLFLMGGIERILTIIIQIALSLVVLYAVKERKNIYLLVAILLHTLVDSPVVYMSSKGISIVWIEVYVLIFALAGLIFIVKSKNKCFNLSNSQSEEIKIL